MRWLKRLFARPVPPPPKPRCFIREGGGAHFGDDLWSCVTCGRKKYPESFTCPHGHEVPHILLPTNPWQPGADSAR